MKIIVAIILLGNIQHPRCEQVIKRQSEDAPVVFPDIEEIPENTCASADGSEGVCRPTGLCVFRLDTFGQTGHSSCALSQGEIGICCPKKPPPTRGTGPLRPIAEGPVSMPDITLNELDSAGEEGLTVVQKIEQLEIELKRKGLFTQKKTKEHFHQAYFSSFRKDLPKLGRDGLTGVEATLKLVKTFQLNLVQSQDGLRRFSLTNTILRDTCPKVPPCPPTKYRTADGSCNNLENSSWGRSFTAYSRLLPARYHDGINSPRISYDGGPLPSPREVSHRISPSVHRPSRKFTLFFAQFAEFLAHDLVQTGLTTGGNGEGIICCHEEIERNERLLHPACLPIYIPSNDPFYSKSQVNCMDFVRSLSAPRPDCNFGPREQLNQVTAHIDGSVLYGSSVNQTNSLRAFVGGRMKSFMRGGEELLTPDEEGKVPCMTEDRDKRCFVAGDPRVNEHPLLSAMHTLWLREHNRIAKKLSRLNPGWNDEILFLEAKRLVAAEMQHITYTEFLPLLLGSKVMSSFHLSPKLEGFSFDYDSHLNTGIVNAFSTAAFRMGHSLVQGEVKLFEKNHRIAGTLLLKNEYYRPARFYDNGTVDMVLRSMAENAAQTFDKYVTDHLTHHLFQSAEGRFGLDLIALNIQRGRDHGLAGYNEWREHCGLPRIGDFEQLAKEIDPASSRNFSRLYRNVDDIDLFPAGISENLLPDANLGPTFSCIVAEQFRRLKHGDRFWYENGGLESSFSQGQLSEIRKTTFSRILCDNSDVDSIQLVAFLKPEIWNPVEPCKRGKIPKMDLSAWRNEPVWT